MKREDVKAKINGITEEQLDWLMGENGRDITAEKAKLTPLENKVTTLTEQLNTAQNGLAAFDGVDVEGLKGQITTLQAKMQEQADGFAFDAALDSAIRDASGKSVKAIRGMLDIDALKASKNRTADIKTALDALAADNAWAFGAETQPSTHAAPTVQVNTGAEQGQGGSAETDGVMAAFAAMNPGMKL